MTNTKPKTFKILSIDGGGIKGVYSAKIISEFEKQYQCNVADYFDLICGTSTGGLISLGLSLKIPAEDICKFYLENGEKIFPKSRSIRRQIKQIFWRGKYDDKGLKKVLKSVFGESKIRDSHTLLCIPAYSLTAGGTRVIKYDHTHLNRDNDRLYTDVCLATSAAPTYFPIAEFTSPQEHLIDGGVWANNPVLVGYLEAIQYFVGSGKEYDSIQILSIPSLFKAQSKPITNRRQRSFFYWKDYLFDIMISGRMEFSDFFMKKLDENQDIPVEYYRVPTVPLSPEDSKVITMDNSRNNAINTIFSKGERQGSELSKKKEIEKFFQNHKTYKTQ